MAYCADTDLMLGNIPLPNYISATKYVSDAADEIDSRIGFVYQTPVDLDQNDPTTRPARLLLKRINAHLATGRLILALDAGGEDDRLHAYGYSLVQESIEALASIAEGKISLEGALPVEDDSPRVSTVIVNNIDEESNVEAFYDRVASPTYGYGPFYGGLGESLVRR